MDTKIRLLGFIPVVSLTSFVTLGTSVKISETQDPHLQNGHNNNGCMIDLL